MKENDWIIGAIAAAIVGYLVWPKNKSEPGVPGVPSGGSISNQPNNSQSNQVPMDAFSNITSVIQKVYAPATPEELEAAKLAFKEQIKGVVKQLLEGGDLTEPILAAIKPKLAEWAKSGELMK